MSNWYVDGVFENLTWDIVPDKPDCIGIWRDSESYRRGEKPIMTLFGGEIIESLGRKFVVQHVRNCDRSPWLKKWKEQYHETFDAIKKSE